MPSTAPTDFNAIVANLLAQHAFDEREHPLATSYDKGDNGPALILLKRQNLDQAQIGTVHQSFADALTLYMPYDKMASWMHEYFATDFTGSKSFRNLLKNSFFPRAVYGELDSSLTLDLDNPQRVRSDRNIFTKEELEITQEVCRKIPAIVISVIGYQAAFVEYLDKLAQAIDESPLLNDAQRRYGHGVVDRMDAGWKTDNFRENILPAIALHYYKNHEGKIGEPPTQDDFTQGMAWAVKSGIFKNTVKTRDGTTRHFTCPARGLIVNASKEPGRDPTTGPPGGEAANMGVGLFHIYRAVNAMSGNAAEHMFNDIQQMIPKADGPER